MIVLIPVSSESMPPSTGGTLSTLFSFLFSQLVSHIHIGQLLAALGILLHQRQRPSNTACSTFFFHMFNQNKVSLNLSPAATSQTSSEVSPVHAAFDGEKLCVCFGCKKAVRQSLWLLKCR